MQIDISTYGEQVGAWLDASVPTHFFADSDAYREPTLDELLIWERELYEAGYAATSWPVEYGGQGQDMMAHLAISREIGLRALPESANSIGKEIVSAILLALGTEEQKRYYLPRIARMEDVWAQAFSEPQAGSDLAAVATTAQRDGDNWRINGQKIWTSYADRAQYCLLLARTGDPHARYKNLSLIVVPLSTAGISVRPIVQIDGSAEFNEVFFDNVIVPVSHTVGAVGCGWSGAMSVLTTERATNRMYRGWRFENELRHLVSACRSDPYLADVLAQSRVQDRIAATAIDYRIVQKYAEKIAAVVAAGEAPGTLGNLMKLHWSEAHQRFASFATELLGNARPAETSAVSRARERFSMIYWRSRSESLIAGTTEIQLSIIADRELRLEKAA